MAIKGPVQIQNFSGPASTGAVTVPSGGSLQGIAVIAVGGIGKVLIIGSVGGAGPLTQLTIALSAAKAGATDNTSGAFVTELATTNDYATPAGILERSSTSPNTAANGTSFRIALDLEGAAEYLLISAASTNGATLTIDACGQEAVTG